MAARFRKKEPAIQAFDLVMEHGGFSEGEDDAIRSGFSLTTLRRLMESKDVRAEVGLTVKDGQLRTRLPGNELIKPLRKMVLDIATKEVESRRFNKKEQMLEYVRGFKKSDKPDLSKQVAERPIEGIEKKEFARATKKTVKRRSPPERKHVVPKNCPINVTDNRISEIYQELQTLKLDNARNAIAVLLRVFLEMSVDHFLENNGSTLRFTPPGGREQKQEA